MAEKGLLTDGMTDLRITELENRLAAVSNLGSAAVRAGTRPPKPTGLTYSTQPGIIAFEWDDSPAFDLLNYRVRIADNSAFTSYEEYTVTDPRFVYYGGVAGTTYYCKVSARNRSERSSDFTTHVSSQIGEEVASDGTTTGATVTYATFNLDTGFSNLNTNNETETYGPVVCDLENTTSFVMLRIVAQAKISSNYTGSDSCRILYEVLRRIEGGTDTVIYSHYEDMNFDMVAGGPSDAPRGCHYIAPPIDQPGRADATWEYRLRVTTKESGSNSISWTGKLVRLDAIIFQ